jgi:hypothetical protein
MEVRTEHEGTSQRPSAVSIYAINQNGTVVVDTRIANGARQQTQCCG